MPQGLICSDCWVTSLGKLLCTLELCHWFKDANVNNFYKRRYSWVENEYVVNNSWKYHRIKTLQLLRWTVAMYCFSCFSDFQSFLFLFFDRKFVKDQKQVQEDISRMSSKAISKVQDDIKSLKQLLSVSASGLQRQGLGIDKLKLETAQVKTVHLHRFKLHALLHHTLQ